MGGKWLAIAFLGALLLVTGTSANSSPLPATSIHWTGSSTIQLSEVALDHRSPADAHQAAFHLGAEHVRIETDWQRKLVAGSVVSTTTQPAQTSSMEFTDWTASWTANTSAGLFITGDSSTALFAAAGAGAIESPSMQCLAEPTYFTSGRTPACADLSMAIQVSLDSTAWSLAGNFTVSLWQWETPDGQWWSGSRPVAASNGVGEYEFRSLHLIVTNGQLEFSAREPGFVAYGTSLALTSTSDIAISLTGQDQSIISRGTLAVTRTASGLSAQVLPSAAKSLAAWLPRAGWAIGATALVASPALALGIRRRIASNHLMQASRNMLIGNHLAAFSHAYDAFRHRRFKQEAGLVAAIALIQGGELEQAEAFIDQLGATHARPAVAYLSANLRMRQGRTDEARALLDECVRLDPTFKAEVAANRLFAPLASAGAGYE